MAVTPNTRIRLLKSPIELDNLNQLTFANEEAQRNYFLSLPHIEIDNCTYQRKDDIIRFPAHIDSILEYNYVMYQNSNYTNKWFYAFIDDMTYYSDNTTYIKISTDCFQTWQFNLNVKRSFVVREHTNNDTVGINTVPEGFETGTMILTNFTPITFLRDSVETGADVPNKVVVVVGATIDLSNPSFYPNYGTNYQGLYSGVTYFAFPSDNVEYLNNCLNAVADSSNTSLEDIVSIFMVPTDLIGGPNLVMDSDYLVSKGRVICHKITSLDIDYFRTITYTVPKPTSIDGYTPINKKLLTGEFNIMNITNYQGINQTYRYEFFNGDECLFKMRGALKPECSIYMYPNNYLHNNFDSEYRDGVYSIYAPSIPICNWNSDQYTAWLAGSIAKRGTSYVTGVGKAVIGAGLVGAAIASGGTSLAVEAPLMAELGFTATGVGMLGAGLTASGIGSIASTAAESFDHGKDATANNGSLAGADCNYINSKIFGAYQYCVRNEYARKIDRIFSVIGYKTNEMKIPNVTGRRNWNYVKTQAVAIQADIPQNDLQVIKQMFNNGVTFWHNPATFLDYSQNNDII